MSLISAERPHAFRDLVLDAGETPAELPEWGARIPALVGLPPGVDPTSVFRRLRIALVGVGAVGRVVCAHLARLGVEVLWICDPGRYKTASTLTQLDDPDHVGRPKVEIVGRMAKRLSPETSVRIFEGRFQSLDPTIFADADLLVLSSDNIRAEIELGQIARNLGKPLLQPAVHGATLTAQVRFFGNAKPEAPCPACGLTGQERDALTREIRYSCENPAGGEALGVTESTSHLCSIAGDLGFNQLLRHVLALGRPVVDAELEFNGYTLATRVGPLRQRRDCPADHTIWRLHEPCGPLAARTPRELARAAGLHDDGRLERVSFRVGGARWVRRAVCPAGHGHSVERFVGDDAPVGTCPACDGPLAPEPFYTHATVPSRLLVTRLDRSFGELCVEPPSWVLVREDDDAVLFRDDSGRVGRKRP